MVDSSAAAIRIPTTHQLSDRPLARAASAPRLLFLDLARAVATLMMLQGHTIDALLGTQYRHGSLFHAWSVVRGLTPSTFLFVSGCAFGVVTARNIHRAVQRDVTLRRLRRAAFLLCLGYAMHFPAANIWGLSRLTEVEWRGFLAVDVLQCIGVSLALIQLIAVVSRSRRAFLVISATVAAAICVATAPVWSAAAGASLPLVLRAYLTPSTGSLFPVFPWAAYVTLGAAVGALYVRLHAAPHDFGTRTLAGVAVLLIATALVLRTGVFTWWQESPNVGGARPSQFLLQAGVVCLIIAIVALISTATRWRSAVVLALAQESLTVYVVHICLVYGSPWNIGLRQIFGPTLSPLSAVACALLMWAAMCGLAVFWHRYKHRAPIHAARVRFAIGFLLTGTLIV